MASKVYSEEVKAQVMAALLAGQSVGQVCKAYNLPYKTVWSWKKQTPGFSDPKREIIGELVIEYLHANLITLKAQAEFFRDTNWLKQQPASELAVLHGVCADKGIRLLEALAPQDEPASGDGQ